MASTPTRTRLGADAVADAFERHGITRLYVFPGGTIAPIFVAALSRGIEIFTARHEQGAGYSALAASRLSGTPQVAMVTSGPGVTNIVTCIADAYFDSTPLVVITGQVGTGDMRGDAAGAPARLSGGRHARADGADHEGGDPAAPPRRARRCGRAGVPDRQRGPPRPGRARPPGRRPARHDLRGPSDDLPRARARPEPDADVLDAMAARNRRRAAAGDHRRPGRAARRRAGAAAAGSRSPAASR